MGVGGAGLAHGFREILTGRVLDPTVLVLDPVVLVLHPEDIILIVFREKVFK